LVERQGDQKTDGKGQSYGKARTGEACAAAIPERKKRKRGRRLP